MRGLAVGLLAAVSIACSPARPTAATPISGVPIATGDGWQLSTLRDEGLDAARIDALASRIAAGQYGLVDSLVIARHGRLCYDAYFAGGPSAIHELQSVTKSVTSALVGAAIARGALAGVSQPVVSVLPAYAAAARDDPAKAAITIGHLLTMSAGLDWDESTPSSDSRNILSQMNTSQDWVGFVVSRRAAEPPGVRFVYNSGGVILLGAIISAATGQDLGVFANDALFAPLGIRDSTWYRNPFRPEQVHTGGGLSMRARDQAKFGQMYLDDGVWAGQRVLPAAWVRESIQPKLTATGGAQYGFLWWLPPVANAGELVGEAWGARGQHIFVVRPMSLVVVVNARDDRADGGRQVLSEVLAATQP